MSYDVECPYCEAELEINHDDGYGYAEDQKHQQICGSCDKTFVYTTSISFHYRTGKADCLNGQPHDMRPVCSTAIDRWPDWKRCVNCDHEVRGKYVEPKEDRDE